MRQIRRAGKRVTNCGEPCILPSMSDEPKYTHHSLNIDLAEKDVADEVSAEIGIEIELKAPLWSSPENFVGDTVGVYCKTDSDAARFERAFERRRWEDQKQVGE